MVGGMRTWAVVASLCVAVTAGCSAEEEGAFSDHEEESDFLPFDGTKADGVSDTFVANNVMDDVLFEATDLIGVEAVQAFLEQTPYGRRCFLADSKLGNKTAAQAIVDAAHANGLNPLLLLVRLQVEKSLIGKSSAPSRNSVDFAFGCGCHDGKACNESFRGFDKQLDCAASTMRKHFDAAEAGNGNWNVGVPRTSLDKITVTPANAATASMYAYTPWVLVGKGGNWLVWNISGRFLNHMTDAGLVGELAATDFIGTPCESGNPDACDYAFEGDEGFCHGFAAGGEDFGMCSLDCEGLCPDTPATDTLCVEIEPGRGSCVPLASASNDDCAAIPGTEPVERDRFVGDSGAGSRTKVVCVPAGGSLTGPSCAGQCGSDTAIPDGNGNACFCDDVCASTGDCCGDYEMVCG